MRNLIKLMVNSPFHPHWLDFRNQRKANDILTGYLSGKIIETGAGNCEKRDRILSRNRKITKYIATDYSSWDSYFEMKKRQNTIFGTVSGIVFGKSKSVHDLDAVCDAKKLPYGSKSFDGYCSFEVLEHIDNPHAFMQEARRVLRMNGLCLITMPFIYREHGEKVTDDFQRFTRGGFMYLAESNGFRIIRILTYSYFGTTLAILCNQYLIRKIFESGWSGKILLLPFSPFYFFFFNTLGYIIDSLDHDVRFASHLHVLMQKRK